MTPSIRSGSFCGLGLPHLVAPAETFSYVMPALDGWQRQLAVAARNDAGDRVVVVTDVPAGENARGVVVPPGLTVASPARGEALTTRTRFEWSSDPSGVFLLRLRSGQGPVVRLVTTGTSATLAALEEVGVALPARALYDWSVAALPLGSVDALATVDGVRSSERMLTGAEPQPLATSAVSYPRILSVP